MDTIEFREIQRFSQWWICLLCLLPGLLLPVMCFLPDKNGKVIRLEDVAIPVIVLVFLALWLLWLRLVTVVNTQGVFVNFRGIPFAKRFVSWGDIQSFGIRTYSPLGDYGGWGLRFGFSKGWCYNVKGRAGLSLSLKSGKQLMIGTQQPDLLQQTMTHYFHL